MKNGFTKNFPLQSELFEHQVFMLLAEKEAMSVWRATRVKAFDTE